MQNCLSFWTILWKHRDSVNLLTTSVPCYSSSLHPEVLLRGLIKYNIDVLMVLFFLSLPLRCLLGYPFTTDWTLLPWVCWGLPLGNYDYLDALGSQNLYITLCQQQSLSIAMSTVRTLAVSPVPWQPWVLCYVLYGGHTLL